MNNLYKVANYYHYKLQKNASINILKNDIQRLINNADALKKSINVNFYEQYIYDDDATFSVVDSINSIYNKSMGLLNLLNIGSFSFDKIKNSIKPILNIANATYPHLRNNSPERSKLLNLIDGINKFQVLDSANGQHFYDPVSLQSLQYDDISPYKTKTINVNYEDIYNEKSKT